MIDGTGWADLKVGSFKVEAKLRLSPELSVGMVNREPKLKLLQDKNGNMVVPVVIKKTSSGKTLVLPDTKDITTRAARNTAKEAATEAATKALDKVAPGLGELAPGIGEGAGKLIDGLFGN